MTLTATSFDWVRQLVHRESAIVLQPGKEYLVEAGGEVLVQDQATSVVWGMPGAVAAAGLASAQLPLREVAPAILSRLARGRSAAPSLSPRPSLLQGTLR